MASWSVLGSCMKRVYTIHTCVSRILLPISGLLFSIFCGEMVFFLEGNTAPKYVHIEVGTSRVLGRRSRRLRGCARARRGLRRGRARLRRFRDRLLLGGFLGRLGVVDHYFLGRRRRDSRSLQIANLASQMRQFAFFGTG